MTRNINSTIIKIQTPKGFLLNGLLLGPEKAKTAYIFIHGLGGSLFSQTELLYKLASENSSVLTFDNRGNAVVKTVFQNYPRNSKKYKKHIIGSAHEVFADCLDDIDGAVQYAINLGAKNIFLVGHSTGCQKSIYYLAKRIKTQVKGAVLLAPMSDFADTYAYTGRKMYNKAVLYSKKLVSRGKPHELLPLNVWPDLIDAQRFLSLYTPDSTEEIFSYASKKKPTLLINNKKPVLVILAANDQFTDRPMIDISNWFKEALKNNKHQINMIKEAPHNFLGQANVLQKIVKNWTAKV